jgi:hypothetical protein
MFSKKREEELNSMARELGLQIIKSKAKKRTENDHQQYRIVDLNNTVLAGEYFDMSLEDVEMFLKERARHPENVL